MLYYSFSSIESRPVADTCLSYVGNTEFKGYAGKYGSFVWVSKFFGLVNSVTFPNHILKLNIKTTLKFNIIFLYTWTLKKNSTQQSPLKQVNLKDGSVISAEIIIKTQYLNTY